LRVLPYGRNRFKSILPTAAGWYFIYPEEGSLPTISMFYGIMILMFFKDKTRHNLPHIHARYQGNNAVISLDDGSVLDGSMPSKQLKLVQAWAEIHRDELFADWELASNGEQPYKIDPLH
jgi:hypothetical protein